METPKDEQYQNAMFAKLVEALTHQAKDLVRDINQTMRELESSPPSPAVDVTQVQNFYSEVESKMATHSYFASCSREDIDEYLEGIERYLTHKMYKRLFFISQEEFERDVELSKRFRALEFVKLEHLEVNPAVVSDASLVHAINSLKPMDDSKSPRQKLQCILKCCNYINNLLVSNAGGDFGADDFTPILIYVVIRAQPDKLVSNLAFIERFRNQSRLTGEAQYYFTQLYGAATFIETMDASSLKVNPDEFLAHMLSHGIIAEEQLQSNSPVRNPAVAHLRAASPFTRSASMKEVKEVKETGATPSTPLPESASRQHRQSEAQTPASWQPPIPKSTAELQAEGLSLVLQEEADGQLRARHRYLYSAADNLSVRDVHHLLADYKELVLQYEALTLGVQQHWQAHVNAAATSTAVSSAPPAATAGGGASVAASTAAASLPVADMAASTPSLPQLSSPSPSANLIDLQDTPPQASSRFMSPPPSTTALQEQPAPSRITPPASTSPSSIANFLFSMASNSTSTSASTGASTLFDAPDISPTSTPTAPEAASGTKPIDLAAAQMTDAAHLEQLPSLDHLLPIAPVSKSMTEKQESLI